MTDNNIDTESSEKELFEHYKFVADKGQSLVRIDKFLSGKIEGISRNKVQNAITANCVLVNNTPVKANYKVKPLDEISVVMTFPRKEFELIPEDIPLDIIYEDDELLIVNKAAGMVVHPGHGNYTGTLVNALAYYLKDLPLFSTGEQRPGLVHRIDKDTTGLLVIAKTEYTLAHLAKQFFDKTSKRKYYALVWGVPEQEGTITANIGRSLKNRKVYTVYDDEEIGKHAVTHYKVIKEFGYVSLIECELETGRTHQIRVHLQHIGHPLFGDETYGGDKILRGTTFSKYKQFVQNCFNILPRQALHAKTLGFIHPKTGKEMLFESEIPNDLQTVLDKWDVYVRSRIE